MRYLCPICEHELTARAYCPDCRKMIKEPLVFNGSYLPNESDPTRYTSFEDDCDHPHEFGVPNQDPHGGKKAEKKVTAGGRVVPAINTSSGTAARARMTVTPETYGKGSTHQKKNAANGQKQRLTIVVIIAIIYFIVFLISTLGGIIGDVFSERSDSYVVDETVDVPDLEMVLEKGEPCSGYVHFQMNVKEYQEQLEKLIPQLYPDTDYSFTEGDYDIYESDGYTYYNQYTDFYIGGSEGYIGGYLVSDLVTGELMEVAVCSDDNDELVKLAFAARLALDTNQDPETLRDHCMAAVKEYKEEGSYYDADDICLIQLLSFDSDPGYNYGFLYCPEAAGKY